MSLLMDLVSSSKSIERSKANRTEARRRRSEPCMRVLRPDEIENQRIEALTQAGYFDTSESERLAILHASADARHQAIWHALRRNYDVPPFTLSTFAGLRARGICRKAEGATFHTLTDEAAKLADAIADELARTNNLHNAFIHHAKETTSIRCTCGWRNIMFDRSHVAVKAEKLHARHVRTVEALARNATALSPHG